MEEITLATVLQIANGIGTVGVLALLLIMFYRGDILSRRVYQELTKRILRELCDRVVAEIKAALQEDAERREQD